ncbi:unnamed protein product [Durusdinium trenchii]|uniref:Integrase zinc-binding domain-containing protein n=1 Tax=Durusdinium trenchii TaxID=1381693 RepID=A0ABP0PZL9_9DINO
MCSRSMEIPALRFTVKPRPASCRKGNASKGRWRVQQMQEALGSVGKVIRVRQALQEGDAVWVDYPDVEDELHQGDECWILPRLHETVEIDEQVPAAMQLLQAYAELYRVDGETRRVSVQETAHGLLDFMQSFDLTNEDLACDLLPAVAVRGRGPMPKAHAASLCSASTAECLVNHLWKESSSDQELEDACRSLGIFQEETFGLVALNLRQTLKVSPVALVHEGRFEVESRKSILFPGGWLIFLRPHNTDLTVLDHLEHLPSKCSLVTPRWQRRNRPSGPATWRSASMSEWAREKLKACLDCLDAKRKHKKKTKKPCPPTVDENEETVSVANTEDFEDRPNLHPSLQELKLLHAALRDEPSTDASSGDALGDELRSEPSERSSQYVEDFDICPAF